MTAVVSRVVTSTVYEWVVPVPYGTGAVVGEVRDAVAMAASRYEELTGDSKATSYDDWLLIRVTDEEIVFWFERREPKP
ncbi:hypothetical protein [Nocardia sp. NPDC050793]|uniref:hypothetical protein n=1 Tax=Nocardia sp. NPDC050793 TaxID=3155159 RepID=UPI0033CF754E